MGRLNEKHPDARTDRPGFDFCHYRGIVRVLQLTFETLRTEKHPFSMHSEYRLVQTR